MKARASDIYVEFPAGAVEVAGAAAQEATVAAGAAAARALGPTSTALLRGGGRVGSPVSSMYAEQGSVYGRRPVAATRLGGTGSGGGPGGGPGGGDFLARLEELEQRRANR